MLLFVFFYCCTKARGLLLSIMNETSTLLFFTLRFLLLLSVRVYIPSFYFSDLLPWRLALSYLDNISRQLARMYLDNIAFGPHLNVARFVDKERGCI